MPTSELHNNEVSSGSINDIDLSLVTAVKNDGDITAFTSLMNKYKKRVFNFCLRYTGNPDESDDIAQEVFIKVYRNINGFRQESSFSTWLFRITANTCKNHSRWRKNRKMDELISIDNNKPDDENTADLIDPKDSSPGPEEIMINDELRKMISAAIRKLKPRQRSVIILKDYLGKSYNEIAEILNINLGTVKSTLARGRLNIAKQIEDYCKL